MDIREFQELLGDMLDELPEPFFDELNGGVIVSPHAKENPHSQGGDLYILGEYHRSYAMGNQIVIYYGSFMRLYGNAPAQKLENRAGERDLEIEDERWLREYLDMRACRVWIRYRKGKFVGIRKA